MGGKVHQNVLILNADPAVSRVILASLARRGVRGVVVRDFASAQVRLTDQEWDLVLADATVNDGDGLRLLGAVKADRPELPVVLFGPDSSASVRVAVRAMRAGCEDFLVAPADFGELSRAAGGALEEVLDRLLPGHEVPVAAWAEEGARCVYQIAGRSEALMGVLATARKVAPTSMPVLVTGESGTGKELISYYVHQQSRRAHGPYIRVNCAALTETLLESELFGHERGAFTGACRQRKGRFELAHGGTLLLDEVSETTPRLQAELLRVLEQQDFERVGGSEPVRVNVRVICTSNRDLSAEAAAGRFRSDLYYRISGLHLHVPPLRERQEDIPVLVWHFVNLYAREARRQVAELDGRMLEVLRRHRWPGNVRELRNVVRTALVLGQGPVLSLAASQEAALVGPPPSAPAGAAALSGSDVLHLQELERQAILEALRRTKSHQAKAARLLGITDRTLREKLRRYRRDGQLEHAGEPRWLMEPA